MTTDQGPMQPDYRRRMEAALARVRELEAALAEKERQRGLSQQHWGAELERSMALQVRAEAAEQRAERAEAERDRARADADAAQKAFREMVVRENESDAGWTAAEAREQALRDRVTEITDAEALRDHLDRLNEAGTDFRAAGMDRVGQPFLICLTGPYAESEHVIFGSPWDTEVDWATGVRCDECNAHEHSGMADLHFPVILLSPPTAEHRCEDCLDCLHDGDRCCGCYDGACCTPTADTEESDRG